MIEPEVAGGLGPATVMDRTQHPPVVTRLEYVFDGWLGDALLESFPCFIATQALALALKTIGATGLNERSVQVSKSDFFNEAQPSTELPEFVWLEIGHHPGGEDLALDETGRLVVSRRVLNVFVDVGLENADVSLWTESQPGTLGAGGAPHP